jgi:hypothetical protein
MRLDRRRHVPDIVRGSGPLRVALTFSSLEPSPNCSRPTFCGAGVASPTLAENIRIGVVVEASTNIHPIAENAVA